jgi:hypothetical protein
MSTKVCECCGGNGWEGSDCKKLISKMRAALERIQDCDWVITLPDRMDAVRAIAREALE